MVPNSAWGGEGCLGCDIGYGYLHRIPVSVDRSKPQETIPLLSQPVDTLDPERRKSPAIAKPGQTGITQIDQLISVSFLSHFRNHQI